jgi:hypothetical protein
MENRKMPSERYPEASLMIPRDELVEHAAIGVLKNAAAGIPELANWVAGTVRKTPLLIHDINGQPLFYDFAVARGTELFGNVRVAASKVLGLGVVASELGKRPWDFGAAVKKLTPKVKREFARAKISTPKLVCYSYPKLGVMFEIEGATGPSRVIYDVSSLTRVPDKPEGPESEGFYAWSYYDSLSDDARRQGLARFKKVEKDLTSLTPKVRRDILAARTLASVIDLVPLKYSRNVTRLLQYCTHYGYTHARSHHCFVLHGQQVNDYCAVATCQMILCYYRYYYSQDHIAPSLGYSPGGGCPSDQSPGYKSLSCNHLDSSFDSSPTWEKARDQIDLLRPLKSGISGHARACAGYSYTRWIFGGGLTNKKLYIYDPWPWNADYAVGGAVTWEDWDAITHTNYVYANIKCP